MNGDSAQSDVVRTYFTKLRKFITENQNVLYQSLTNKDELKKYEGLDSIYFFAADYNKSNISKIGRTTDIVKRLRTYNTGRIKEIDLEYYAIVTNGTLIEKCIKDILKQKQVFKGKEIYQIDAPMLKKIIIYC